MPVATVGSYEPVSQSGPMEEHTHTQLMNSTGRGRLRLTVYKIHRMVQTGPDEKGASTAVRS